MKTTLLTGFVCLAVGAYAQGTGAGNGNGNTEGAGANGKVIHETVDNSKAAGQASAAFPTTYHGGPVMTGTPNIYYIWYGDWTNNTGPAILTDLAQRIGGTPYLNINKTYYQTDTNGSKVSVSGNVSYVTSTSVSGGSTTLSDSDIQQIVSTAITGGSLPKDSNGVYFVLTAPSIKKSGFCTSYCGWHTHATIGGTDIKYAFIGNPATQCMSSCAIQTTSPNGNPGADAMASIIAHELEEAVTDPDLNAWYDKRGAENADKCAWTFGTTSTASNGSKYNVVIGSRQYMIQRNWVNDPNGGYCSMQ